MISGKKQKPQIPSPDSNLNNQGIAETIIKFISKYLPSFRIKYKLIKPGKEEIYYNVQIEDHFQRIARKMDTIFYFSGNRPNTEEAYPDLSILKAKEDNHDSIFDIECKRLNSNLSHVKQYVSGKTGGIERFKRNLHGTDLPCSAIIGYVENETIVYWYKKINTWIKDQNVKDSTFWESNEYLSKTKNDYYKSKHNRIGCQSSSSIILFHFFYNNN